nr:hypothetical protein [uncultured Rhodopila sp.]
MKFYGVLLLGAAVLTAAAWLRGAEYDEQYTLFLTAGAARPDWPETAFPAGLIAAAQAGHADWAAIARDLRATDVHPPLYFWAVSVWREAFGPGLFAARLFSVLCGVVSLGLTGRIARQCGIRPAVAMLVTLSCYGFVYANAIARGFAAAEMLTLAGVTLLLGRRPVPAGVMLGAACGCNYLAVFVAAAAMASARAWRAVPAAVPFLALDAWFFAAQHGARPDQFPPFALWPSLLRLAEYQAAAMFGGLPLYVDGWLRVVVGAAVGLVAAGLAAGIAAARPWTGGSGVRLVLAAAAAPPAGLLLLGAVFDNTPIELRYLSFGLPFAGLLVAFGLSGDLTGASHSSSWPGLSGPPVPARAATGGPDMPGHDGKRTPGRNVRQRSLRQPNIIAPLLLLLATLQTASIAGLLFAPRTMQPARAAAAEAARLAGGGIVLLPRGNDGVGIAGAFGIEAPAALSLLLVRRDDPAAGRVVSWRRAVVVTLAQDRDSAATLPALRATLAAANWRWVATGSNVEVYERE